MTTLADLNGHDIGKQFTVRSHDGVHTGELVAINHVQRRTGLRETGIILQKGMATGVFAAYLPPETHIHHEETK